jgi:hypothetical protein
LVFFDFVQRSEKRKFNIVQGDDHGCALLLTHQIGVASGCYTVSVVEPYNA